MKSMFMETLEQISKQANKELRATRKKEREEKKPNRVIIIRDALLGRHKSLRSRDSGLFMPEEEFAMKLAKQINNQLKKYERR